MAGTRKRKHDAAENETAATHFKRQKGIQDFGKAGKAQSVKSTKAVKVAAVQARPQTPPPPPPKVLQPEKEEKRKRQVESDSEADETEADKPAQKANLRKQFAKKKSGTQNKRMKQDLPLSPTETPRSKAATDLFDRMKLDQKAIPFSLGGKPDTPPDTPEAETQPVLPVELQDLVRLYAAFLTALSLHSAHNREMSGMQVSTLLPIITKNWRKRKVTTDDLQMLLAVDTGAQEFSLEDYGRAGIRLAITNTARSNRMTGLVNDDALKSGFETALQARWDEYNLSLDINEPSIPTFLTHLPRLEMHQDASTARTAPLFAKGKQRLSDLKSDRAASLATETKSSSTPPKPSSTTSNRGTNLLDRILAKQSHLASLPSGPTRAQQERRAALHRVEDVTRVLGLLAGTKTRVSYSLPSMVQQLQQSLRNPISRDEVEGCLRVMAEEISPEFVRVVTMGSVQGVVISMVGRVGLEELRGRVRLALEAGLEK